MNRATVALIEPAALAVGWIGVFIVKGVIGLLTVANNLEVSWRTARARSRT